MQLLKYIRKFITGDVSRVETVSVIAGWLLMSAVVVWAYDSSYTGAQVDQAVGIANTIGGTTGIIKSDGSNTPSAATAGTDYYAPGSTDVALGDGGTGASLGDPGANVLIGQEDGATALHHVTLGTGFEYVPATNTLNATGSLSDIVNDTTPQLGGDLDIQTHEIEGISAAEFLILNTYAGIDPSADVQAVLGAANNAAIISALGVYSTGAADLAFEAIDSNDIDPDRLNGDTADDNVIDLELLGLNEATAETSIAADDLVAIYDTSAGALRKMTRGNFVTGIGAGQAVVLDLADDGSDESTDLGEIAVTNDTNSIFSEPSADKLGIDVSQNWPTADVAVEAQTADTATAFFDAGTIEHEYGGLEADVSAYDGLVKIAGETTSAVTITAAGEALIDDANAAAMLATLGIDTAANLETSLSLGAYASDILGAADSDALVTLLGLVAGDIPDLSDTYEAKDADILRADTADNISADLEWQDGVAQSFGNDKDWEVSYDEAGTNTLTWTSAATAAAAATDPMILFRVDSGDSGMTADQDVLEIQKGTTPIFNLDEDGDLTVTGTVYAAGFDGGSTAWDDIGDPTGAGSVDFNGNVQTILTSLDTASGASLILKNDAVSITNASYLMKFERATTDDAQAHFWIAADAGGTLARLDYDGSIYASSFNAIRGAFNQYTDFYESNAEAGDNYHRIVAQTFTGDRTTTLPDYNGEIPNATLIDSVGALEDDTVDYANTTGSFKSLAPVTDAAADFAANFTGASLYGGTFICDTAGTIQLPAVTAGMNFTIITKGAIAVVVEPDSDDMMMLDGVDLDDADSATNTSAAGDIIVFQYMSAAGWIATSNGWTDED